MLQIWRVPKTCRTLHPQPRRGSSSLCFVLRLTNEARLASDFCGQKWIPDVVSGSSAMLRRGWICPRMPHTNAILPVTKIIIRPISPPPLLSLSSVRTHTLARTHARTRAPFRWHVSHSYLCRRAELHPSVSPDRPTNRRCEYTAGRRNPPHGETGQKGSTSSGGGRGANPPPEITFNGEVGGEAEWGSGSSPASDSLRQYQLHAGATRECQQQQQQEQRGDACARWKERERAREAKIHQYVKKKYR